MARKVDQKLFDRIIELKTKYDLTEEVLAQRLGVSARTIRVYLRAHRLNLAPYERPDVQS